MHLAVHFPDAEWLDQIIYGKDTDAAFIQQKYITSVLAKSHELTFLAPLNLHQIVQQTHQTERRLVTQTWSASPWFGLTHRVVWQLQKFIGIPYLNIFSNLSRYDALLRVLPKSEVIYERNSLYNVSVAMACKRLGLPYVIFFDADQIVEHDFMGQPIEGILRWRAQRILRYNLGVARGIICVSEPAKCHLIDKWGVREEKLVVFPNGVDVNLFTPSILKRSTARSLLGVKDENLVILFVGNFYKWHDIKSLIISFSSVHNKHPLARLVLVGSGSQLEAMKKLVVDMNLVEVVHFTGLIPHQEVPGLIAAADIAVAPVPEMDRDLWLSPMKLFEYLATGVAIIASGVGQMAEVIENNVNGLLVTPGSITELTRAINALIENPHLRSELGHQARETAIQKYSWEKYISRLEGVFQAVYHNQPLHGL